MRSPRNIGWKSLPVADAIQDIGKMVDVTGIEPVAPCFQSKPGNIMWLILLAFTYVM